uniref:tyrosine--tRNA ligase n=1 Tax=Hominenteromicrobium sp. TaxID=3073581 RepID=UPI003AF616B1
MGIYEELQARGLIAQVTDEERIRNLINNGEATFYIGFDCTADSLTAGHFMALTLMKRLQMAGNKPIALIGGGTTMIGDPSGRTDMRKMLTMEDIEHNAACFKRQMENFIDFSDGKALMVNNADWLLKLNYVELLREVGACFSVNNMLRAECYKQRMEKGLSFLEFNYMIMQSYDLYALFQKYGCNLQFGGDDQWSNMLGGTELIRRKLGKDAAAMTITLLTDSQGKKMGKTAGNAVWLDPNKTSPFDFYQYWRNVDDSDVLKCIKMGAANSILIKVNQIGSLTETMSTALCRPSRICSRSFAFFSSNAVRRRMTCIWNSISGLDMVGCLFKGEIAVGIDKL